MGKVYIFGNEKKVKVQPQNGMNALQVVINLTVPDWTSHVSINNSNPSLIGPGLCSGSALTSGADSRGRSGP